MRASIEVAIAAGLLAAPFCAGQSISDSDRSYALSALHASRKQVLDTTAGLSKAQWSYKPSSEAWSIAQIVEHLALLEEQLPAIVEGALKSPPAPDKKPARPREADAKLLALVPQRTSKAQAPEPFKPNGKFKNGISAVMAFKAARDANLETVRTTAQPLREHFSKHPVLGDIDAYQWYLLVAAHTERHVNQMLEVKASPAFPKK
jgi:hypothetical protein